MWNFFVNQFRWHNKMYSRKFVYFFTSNKLRSMTKTQENTRSSYKKTRRFKKFRKICACCIHRQWRQRRQPMYLAQLVRHEMLWSWIQVPPVLCTFLISTFSCTYTNVDLPNFLRFCKAGQRIVTKYAEIEPIKYNTGIICTQIHVFRKWQNVSPPYYWTNSTRDHVCNFFSSFQMQR